MATFSDRLKSLREEQKISQEDLAGVLTLSQSTIAYYETGRKQPSQATLQKMASFFEVSVDYLIGRSDRRTLDSAFPPIMKTISIPILGRIKAGIPILSEENYEGEVQVPADVKADFALRVSGDSMSWAGISEGDIAVLRQSATPSHGAVVAAVEEGSWETTLKFFVKDNGNSALKAANPEYKDIPITPKHKILGVVVTILKNTPSLNDYLAHLMYKDISDRKWQHAMELANQAGLDGAEVAKLISLFMSSVRSIKKT